MQVVDTGVADSARTRRRKNRRRRTLQESTGNLLDVYHEGNDNDNNRTETAVVVGPRRARCNLIGMLPMRTDFPMFGYENALAMQLAVKHLNEGNGGLVPALSGLNETCPITFSLSIADTHWDPRKAFQTVDTLTESSHSEAGGRPCAFVGAVRSAVTKSTAMVTGLRGYPQISHASTSRDLDDKLDYPLFGRTVPDDGFMAEALVRFFYETLGVRHLFVIVEQDPFPRSVLKSLRDAVLRLGLSPGINSTVAATDEEGNSVPPNPKPNVMYVESRLIENYDLIGKVCNKGFIYEALEALKASEFRFVLALTGFRESVECLMDLAYEAGVAGHGTHHWWFYETLNLNKYEYAPSEGRAKAFNGVGYIYQASIKQGSVYDQFAADSRQLKRELYGNGTTTAVASSFLFDTFQDVQGPLMNEIDWLVDGYAYEKPSYAYDAAVMLGLSACREVAASGSLVLTGTSWFERLRNTNFTGVTGSIVLDPETATRDGHSVQYAIDNWRAVEDRDRNVTEDGRYPVVLQPTTTYVLRGGGSDWDNVDLHVFSGGLNTTSLGAYPDLPPLDITYGHVNAWISRLVIGMLVVILAATAWFAIWTCRHWNSRVVQASQPYFLLLVCLGIAITALAMVPISMEHGDGRVDENVWYDRVCTSTWWFAFVGLGITFSTLFTKTYRINKIMANSLKCKRIKLTIRETMYPVIIIFSFNVIMLSLMTIFLPTEYRIVDTKYDRFGRTSQRYGSCNSDDAGWFLVPIGIVNFGVVGLALFQAWRARHLSTEFAESTYIAHSLLIILLAAIFAIPVNVLVQNDPNIDTFINAALACVFTVNPLCYIFIPKIVFHVKSKIPPSKRRSHLMASMLGSLQRSHTYPPPSSRASSVAGTIGRTRGSDSGEKILTSKPQVQLVSEIQALELKNVTYRAEIEDLRERLLAMEASRVESSDAVDGDEDDGSASSRILEDASYEFHSATLIRDGDDGEDRDSKSRTGDETRMEDVSS